MKSKCGSYCWPDPKLLFIFSQKQTMPMYYRMVPGNINDVKSFRLSIKESGVSDATVIADKGFYSQSNIQELKDSSLHFIIPLQRTSSLIEYEYFKKLDKSKLDGYFTFNGKTIWHKTKGEVTTFLNEELKIQEQNDYLQRITTHPEDYSIESFHKKEHSFGTLSLLTNVSGITAEESYSRYKSRAAIEQLFDAFKNLLEADRSYMRDNLGLEGWIFVNHIALCWYYGIYRMLLNSKLLDKLSVRDVLTQLAKVTKIKIQDSWVISEITSKVEKNFAKLGIAIT